MGYTVNATVIVSTVTLSGFLLSRTLRRIVTRLVTSRQKQRQTARGVVVPSHAPIYQTHNIQGVERVVPESTKAQKVAIAKLKETYGSKTVKEHAADATTGHVRVELKCESGTWNWFYDRNGLYISGSLTQRLFEPEPPPHTPGNALDN